MKLVLGAGSTRYKGWKHLDIINAPGIDYTFDLNNAKKTKLPIQEDTVVMMRMEHTFEHISNQLDLMSELWRVAKNNCLLWVTTPYGWSEDAWVDPTHVRPIFMRTYQYFGQPKYYGFDYGYRGDWKSENFYYILKSSDDLKKIRSSQSKVNLDELLKKNAHAVSEIGCLLKAIKPRRPANKVLMTIPKQYIVHRPFSLESILTKISSTH